MGVDRDGGGDIFELPLNVPTSMYPIVNQNICICVCVCPCRYVKFEVSWNYGKGFEYIYISWLDLWKYFEYR